MKKVVLIFLAMIFSFCLCMGAGCGKNPGSNTDQNINIENKDYLITLKNKNLYLYQFDQFLLEYVCKNPVQFESVDKDILSVSDEGLITGLKIGTGKIRVYNDYHESFCSVKVMEDVNIFYIKTSLPDDEELNITVGSEVSVNPKVIFRGNERDDAVISFDVQNDNIQVSEDFVVKGNKAGQSELILKADFFGSVVKQKIVVNVVNELAPELVSENKYLNLPTNGKITIPCEISENNAVKEVNFTYTFDENLLVRNGNEFSVKEGVYKECVTKVYAKYVNDQGKEYVYEFLVQIVTGVDNTYLESGVVYQVENCIMENVTGHDPEFNYSVVSSPIIRIEESGVDLGYNPETKKLNKEAITKGNRIWNLFAEDGLCYPVKVSVVDAVIRTADDIDAILPVAKNEHLVLGNDIVYNEDSEFGERVYINTENFFSGILDGQNHYIKGLKYGKQYGGLFYWITNGVIKNLSLIDTNCTWEESELWSSGYCKYAIAWWVDRMVVENCMFSCYSLSNKGSATGLIYGPQGSRIIIKDSLFIFDGNGTNNYALSGAWAEAKAYQQDVFRCENVYTSGNKAVWPGYSADVDKGITVISKDELSAKALEGNFINSHISDAVCKAYDLGNSIDHLSKTDYLVDINKGSIDFGSDYDVEKVTDSGRNLDYSAENKLVDIKKLKHGERQWKLYCKDGNTYSVSVTVVDKIIMTAEEFNTLLPNASNECFALGADIVFNEDSRTGTNYYANNTNTFTGLLDGRNHGLKGLRYGNCQGGLFFWIEGGKVENIYFEDVNLTAYMADWTDEKGNTSKYEAHHSVVSKWLGNATISNVYASAYADLNKNKFQTGGLFYGFQAGVKDIKNVVVEFKGEEYDYAFFNTLDGHPISMLNIENIHCISENAIYPGYAKNPDKNLSVITRETFETNMKNGTYGQGLKDFFDRINK